MNSKTKYFILSVSVALCLCGAQVLGNAMAVIACLVAFLLLLAWACAGNFTLPLLLFFLPWSQLLRTSPNTFSFFTFGLVLVCALSIQKNWRKFRKYHILGGLALLFLTLLSKLIDGSGLSFDYIAFIMLLLLFPVVKEEWSEKYYSFYPVVIFFAAGVVLAALCAQIFSTSPHISAYINVDSYLSIRRLSGFYGDPNFYTAQILAALGGCLILVLQEQEKRKILLCAALILLLIYSGLLSASKSFAITVAILVLLWIIEVMKMEGRRGFKVTLLIGSILTVLLMIASAVFSEMLDVLFTRFSYSKDLSDFTTGRTDIWLEYGRELLGNGKLLLLGKGFTKAVIHEKASHNTIIQIFYQFGLLGSLVLFIWIVGFYGNRKWVRRPEKRQWVNRLILLTGVFFPWLAIDILFFDEFFLLQWFVFVGMQQINTQRKEGELRGTTSLLR